MEAVGQLPLDFGGFGVRCSVLLRTFRFLPDRFLTWTTFVALRVRSSLKLRFNGSLKQFLAMRLDIGGKPERVVARALFGEFGVALFERFDDGQCSGSDAAVRSTRPMVSCR